MHALTTLFDIQLHKFQTRPPKRPNTWQASYIPHASPHPGWHARSRGLSCSQTLRWSGRLKRPHHPPAPSPVFRCILFAPVNVRVGQHTYVKLTLGQISSPSPCFHRRSYKHMASETYNSIYPWSLTEWPTSARSWLAATPANLLQTPHRTCYCKRAIHAMRSAIVRPPSKNSLANHAI